MVKKTEETHDADTGEVVEIEKTTGGELAVQTGSTALTVADEWDYGEDAGLGRDNQTAEDVSIPFYVLLQPGSPQVQTPDSPYKAGMIINNTTGEVVADTKNPFNFIPCYTEHLMVEWVKREKGGGLVASHAIESDLAKKVRAEQPLGKYTPPDNPDHDLIETFYVYGLAVDKNGVATPGVLSFSSTGIKPYKDWMFRTRSVVLTTPTGGKVTSANMPLWAFCYALTTVFVEKNNYKWYNYAVGWAGKDAADSRVPPRSDLYTLAKGVYEGVSSGRQKADTTNMVRADANDAAPERGDTSAEAAPY